MNRQLGLGFAFGVLVSLAVVAYLLSDSTPGAGAISPNNLLARRNPSFENGFKQWSFREKRYQPTHEVVEGAPLYCGEKSLQLTRLPPPIDDNDTLSVLRSRAITIPTSGNYIVSVWIKRTSENGTEYSLVDILLREESAKHKVARLDYSDYTTREQWGLAQSTIQLQAGVKVWLAIKNTNRRGKVFIDCASIVKE